MVSLFAPLFYSPANGSGIHLGESRRLLQRFLHRGRRLSRADHNLNKDATKVSKRLKLAISYKLKVTAAKEQRVKS